MMQALESALKSSALVGYVPMADEPDVEEFLSARGFPRADFVIPASKDTPPETIEKILKDRYPSGSVALLIPGRAFDILGTRHGRGHGWYDRLLSKLPSGWIRVGVLGEALLSEKPLERKEWDEPVDFLIIKGENGFTVVETKARTDVLKS